MPTNCIKVQSSVSKILLFDKNNNLVLYLRDDKPTIPFPNTWDLLGGGIETGETAEEAAIREIAEEVGAEITELTPFAEYFIADKWLFYIFTAKTNKAVEDMVLTEGVRLEAIKLEDWRDYITEPLGQVFEDFTSTSD